MAGVDRFDQLRAAYTVGRSSKKMWRHIFWFLVNTCIVNAFILYRQTCRADKPLTHLQFRLQVALGLIGGYSHRNVYTPRAVYLGTNNLSNVCAHANQHMQAKRPRRCFMHAKFQPDGRIKADTVYGCKECNLHLCKLCHVRFHTQ